MLEDLAWLDQLKVILVTGNDWVVAFNAYLAEHYGKTFQVAVDWVLLGLLLVFMLRVFKFSFDVLRYVLVPSVLLSGLIAVFTSASFLYVMPMAMGIGTVFMLFKN